MITFFRKTRKDLMKQNTSPRYLAYAFGEVFLVVIGILIALAINNWNENRKARRVEQVILHNLKSELLTIKADLKEAHELHSSSHQDGLGLLRLFGKDVSKLSRDKLDSMVANFESGWSLESRDGYIKSIISSGRIDYLQNESLKSKLSAYEATLIDATQENIPINKLIHDRFWPLVDGRINSSNRLRQLDEYDMLPPGSYQSDYKWFFENREIEDIISNIESWRVAVLNDEQTLDNFISEMLALIDQEIKN